MQLIFSKPAVGGMIQYILMSYQTIKKLTYENHAKLKLEWEIYTVRDRSYANRCYNCQKYGHLDASQLCYKDKCKKKKIKCAGDHNLKECAMSEKKLVNCIEYMKPEFNGLYTK